MSSAIAEVKPFIEGGFCPAGSNSCLEVFNPSNGRQLMTIPEGAIIDVERAVTAARRAFDAGTWQSAPARVRQAALHRLADLIDAESQALDQADAEEMGKPVSEAVSNAAAAAQLTHFYAECIGKLTGDVYGSDVPSFVVQRRSPRGVVAAIVSWNFPTFNAVLKVAPALAAGNSVILKPSELSSRSALRIAELVMEAGIPAGVCNVVPGSGAVIGRALASHLGVDMIAFTGSTTIGKRMLEYIGQSSLKAVMLECGGKSPQIVFDDCPDLEVVAAAVARSLLLNQGQVCTAGTRLLVHRSVREALLEKLFRHVAAVVAGDARDPATTYGPLASKAHRARVEAHIEQAQTDGARLVNGGTRLLAGSGGYFLAPTIFAEVSPQSRLAQEEVFGPVLSTMEFEHETQAVQLANATGFGLMAYVWTTGVGRALRVTRGLRSSVIINAAPPRGAGAGESPSWEPAGQSGLGIEGGLAGLESYQRRQVLWFNHD